MNKVTGKDILEVASLEKKYEEQYGGNKSNGNLYPNYWYDLEYSTRKRILNNAIEKNTTIQNLEEVQQAEMNSNVSALFETYNKNIRKGK